MGGGGREEEREGEERSRSGDRRGRVGGRSWAWAFSMPSLPYPFIFLLFLWVLHFLWKSEARRTYISINVGWIRCTGSTFY